jgi:hydroxymethylpyrimidine pyrophosphatase-like HAD family hydrolase
MNIGKKRKELKRILDIYQNGVWVTREGKLMEESEMDDNHVENLLNYIERNGLITIWECDATEADIF